MDLNTLSSRNPNFCRNVLGDLTNVATSTRSAAGEKQSRLEEARHSLSLLTGSKIETNTGRDEVSIGGIASSSSHHQHGPLSSYDSLEEKATPLKKRKRVYNVAILRRSKPKKENITDDEIAYHTLPVKIEQVAFVDAPDPSSNLEYHQFDHLLDTNNNTNRTGMLNINDGTHLNINDGTLSSTPVKNVAKPLFTGNSSSNIFQIDDGRKFTLDGIKEEDAVIEDDIVDNFPSSYTYMERDSVLESDSSLTNINWLRRLGALDTVSNQQNHLMTDTNLSSQFLQPMVHRHQRPPYSYSALIQFAISSFSTGRMTLKEIYQWIEDRFPFFRSAKPGWKNSIRHNLSLHKMFIRQPPVGPGKSAYWTLQPGTVVRLPSKRNLNFHNDEENTMFDQPLSKMYRPAHDEPNRQVAANYGIQTKRPLLLPRPTLNPALMPMPVVWNASTNTYQYPIMSHMPDNYMPGNPPITAYGPNCMVINGPQNNTVVKIAPKINVFNNYVVTDGSVATSDRSRTWSSQSMALNEQSGLADRGFQIVGGLLHPDFSSNYKIEPKLMNTTCPYDSCEQPFAIKEEQTESVVQSISTPIKEPTTTPSKCIGVTSTPSKLFSELDFLSPIQGITPLRTSLGGDGLSPLGNYLFSPSSSNTLQYRSPTLGSLREFGLRGFTPRKVGDMNVSVQNQSFDEIFGDMNISLDNMVAADISWSTL